MSKEERIQQIRELIERGGFVCNADAKFLLSELEPQTVAETITIEVLRCRACPRLAISVNGIRQSTSGMSGHGSGKCAGSWTTIAQATIHSPAPDTKLLVDALEEVVRQTQHRGGDTYRTASSALTSYRGRK